MRAELISLGSMEVFRPRRVLAVAVGVCAALWLLALGYLLSLGGAPWPTLLFAALFVAFFTVALAYYGRSAFFVDSRGFIYRGMWRSARFGFEEVRRVSVLPGPVTVYSVRARGRILHFTNLFRGHRRLMELLVQRSGLAPSAA